MLVELLKSLSLLKFDPHEGWVNLGTYINPLHDAGQLAFISRQGIMGGHTRDKYFSRGEACPVAIVFGSDPLLFQRSYFDKMIKVAPNAKEVISG